MSSAATPHLSRFLPPLSVRRRLKDILLCPARQIVFRDIIARNEFVDADAQRRAQLRIERHVRQTYPALPLETDLSLTPSFSASCFCVRPSAFLFARDVLSDPDEIHKTVLLCVDRFLYSRTAAKRTPPESRILSFHGEMRARAFFSLQTDKFDAILSLYDLRQNVSEEGRKNEKRRSKTGSDTSHRRSYADCDRLRRQ